MQSALDRRQMILEALSDRRQENIESLATEFGVSKRTIRYDIEILCCSAPIYTVQGGGGGIRVADGWYVGRRYLRSEQEQLLRELMDGLQPDQQKTMQSMENLVESDNPVALLDIIAMDNSLKKLIFCSEENDNLRQMLLSLCRQLRRNELCIELEKLYADYMDRQYHYVLT